MLFILARLAALDTLCSLHNVHDMSEGCRIGTLSSVGHVDVYLDHWGSTYAQQWL